MNRRDYFKDYRIRNAEKISLRLKVYYRENKEKIRVNKDTSLSTLDGRLSMLLYTARNTARIKHYDFNLCKDSLLKLWHQQNGLCALTGLRMTFDKPNSLKDKSSQLVSLDRKDCNKGYTHDNVQLICYSINMLKKHWENEEFIDICKLVVDHSKRRGN